MIPAMRIWTSSKRLYDKDAFSLGRDAVATHSGKGSAKGFGKALAKEKPKVLEKAKAKPEAKANWQPRQR